MMVNMEKSFVAEGEADIHMVPFLFLATSNPHKNAVNDNKHDNNIISMLFVDSVLNAACTISPLASPAIRL